MTHPAHGTLDEPEAGGFWCHGPVDGVTDGGESRLKVRDCGAELAVSHARLIPGSRYHEAPPETRHYLARVGALLRLRTRGRFHVHAAGAVAPNGRAWLLCGESGSGKSTLAYALVRGGWGLLGDDGVVLEAADGGATAHGWREPMRLSIELARWFPELRMREAETDWSDPRHRTPVEAPFVRRAPVAGIIVLERGARDQLSELAPTAALATLVRQSTFLMLTDGHARAHLDLLRTLVQSVPCHRLEHTTTQLLTFPSTMREVA